jgi:hypothetical protein
MSTILSGLFTAYKLSHHLQHKLHQKNLTNILGFQVVGHSHCNDRNISSANFIYLLIRLNNSCLAFQSSLKAHLKSEVFIIEFCFSTHLAIIQKCLPSKITAIAFGRKYSSIASAICFVNLS